MSENILLVDWQIQEASEIHTRSKSISKIKYSNGWKIVCQWSSRSLPFPQFIFIGRKTAADRDLVVGGKLTLSTNDKTVFEKKILKLMESGSESVRIHLGDINQRLDTFEASPSLSLKGSVEISHFQGTYRPAPPRMELLSLEQLSRDLKKLSHPETSCIPADVILKCGNTTFPAHKTILCARSPVFAAMFAIPMKESVENQVDITDISESVLTTMGNYMYTGMVKDITVSSVLDLLVAADKYQLLSLKLMCCDFLKENISDENVLMLLDMGDAVDENLKSFAMNYICRCPEFSAIQNTDAWKSLERLKPALAIETLTSMVKSKDERIKRLKTS